ncbi:NAD(P)-binding protein [Sphingomonas sp. SUN039]|uniref:NAD(P)-binding protein n=1 Tax=Sphingomonas sp. SUN039 TaxID=2937787 RepID=UPI002164AF8A|nr:NAD(P)-binding protein [Sphingomonas sp. SUN039]UVO55548.1 NAD(P)-binding protein [Sphingomonas sp. SUN039]
MAEIETDYLVVGAGAVGLAFADTLLTEAPNTRIAIVDRHGKPGGHWNDAYAFVALHQPSAFYGVNSLQLGSGHIDTIGVNAGLNELASGPEVSGYFDTVMRQRLLPSGRVAYLPMSDHVGEGRVVSLLSGAETNVAAKKIVDATYYGTTVPSTHTPKFHVGEGVRLVTPNALPHLWQAKGAKPKRYVILGAGKTAMDVGVWLLGSGAAPDAIQWVMPRDSWLLNRLRTQPGIEFFDTTIGGQVAQMEAFAQSGSVEEIFERLEAAGVTLRIYPDRQPTMFHYATISEGEVAELRRITDVVRLGRVQSIGSDTMVLEEGTVPVTPDTLFIDCTASAVEVRPALPIFDGNRITPQLVRVPQPAFSAALVAYVEAHYPDDAAKNALCRTVPFPETLGHYPMCNIVNMMNQFAWSQDKALSRWIRDSRLDGFGKVIAAVKPEDTEKVELLTRFRSTAMAAMVNLQKLTATGS